MRVTDRLKEAMKVVEEIEKEMGDAPEEFGPGNRGSIYGPFMANAKISQGFKIYIRQFPGWNRLAPDQKECLDQMGIKLSRILSGDPNYLDNWRDLEGYPKIVADRMEKEQDAEKSDAGTKTTEDN